MSDSKQVLPQSWMSLYLELYRNDILLGTGTGFTVTKGSKTFLLTNRHVISGRDNNDKCLREDLATPNKLKIYFNKKPDTPGNYGNWVIGEMDLYADDDDERTRIWLEHPQLGIKIDVVAIELTASDKIDFCPYNIYSTPNIQVYPSDNLSVVGFPFGKRAHGYLAIWTTGFLATDIDLDYDGLPLFLIDCRARTGQSGSPVLAQRNGGFMIKDGAPCITTGLQTQFLGIYSGRISKESDLGFVWKTSIIHEIIS